MELTPGRQGREMSPRRRLRSLEDEMDSLFGRVFGREPAAGEERIWAPLVDVKETKTDVVVKAELPGINAGDVDITVEKDILTIRGERKAEDKKEEEGYHYVERSYGSFVRSLRLPGEVDETKTKAKYRDGVLTITMPKKKEEKAKQVKVEVE